MHATTRTSALIGPLFTLFMVGATAMAPLESVASSSGQADPDRGKTLFLQCKACHVSEQGAPHTVGPSLWDIVGRPVGSQAGFAYSKGLKALGGTWDYEKLDRYLEDPRALAPDTRMLFPGIAEAGERADVIAYLFTLSDQPATLPESAAVESARLADDSSVLKQAPGKDWQGLPPGPGREEVFYSCGSCHSLRLVTQQGLSRDSWDETLEWMVEEQGMSEIEDRDMRDRILDYLSTHFGSG